MGNILNHNRPVFEIMLSKNEYWDHHLYDNQKGDGLYDTDVLDTECLSAFIDTTYPDCIEDVNLISLPDYTWEDAVNNGIELNNIGLTGVDNGLITFDKTGITEEEFMELYSNSKMVIPADDLRLHTTKVDGNNKIYSYPNEYVTEDGMNVAKLQGGFFQGFFKTGNGCNYQVLPSEIEHGWTMEFTLKPGKFQSNYSVKREKYSEIDYNSDGWDGTLKDNEYSDGYLVDNYTDDNPAPILNDIYPENEGIFFYIGTRAENKWWKYYVDSTDTTELTTDNEISLNSQVTEISTDNKFITYNRTKGGLKAWMGHDVDDSVTIRMNKPFNTENYFIIMNRAKGGYTARTIKQLKEESGADYDILADLYRNAFAFQIREDGSVGYKFMVKNCETETGYEIKNEWSNPGTVTMDEWVTITVRILPVGNVWAENYDIKADNMRLLFYVNGKLVLYSKELPMLALRMLNDQYVKQESVPYNISLGGGTQGLCDVIYEDFNNIPEYVLFLEKEFGGSFMGYFKSFKFYTCDKHYDVINHNYLYERYNILKGVTYYNKRNYLYSK